MGDKDIFRLKRFAVKHRKSKMKVGFDGILLGAWANTKGKGTLLDIGTGTGIIALMQAQKNPNLFITAIEPDKDSFLEAMENAASSPWADRIKVLNTSLQQFALEHKGRFDYIITNPPYFDAALKYKSLEKAEAKHTVTLSHEELLRLSSDLLNKNGRFFVILPFEMKKTFASIAIENGLYPLEYCSVITQINKAPKRILMQFSKNSDNIRIKNSELHVYKSHGQYSGEYVRLIKDFYLWA